MTRPPLPPVEPSDLEQPIRLVPEVKELTRAPGGLVLRPRTVIALEREEDRAAAETLAGEIRAAGGEATIELTAERTGAGPADGAIRLGRSAPDPRLGAEGYALEVDARGAQVRAPTAAGVYYGAQTLRQLIVPAGSGALVVPAVRVRDWPAMRWRGAQDDVSRGPVPTVAYVKEQITTLASYKANLYSLYWETAFAFDSHPLLARGAVFTRDEVREIVEHAARHQVTVLPQQQTFGHMHSALLWERYRDLAERPHGHVLAPGPASDRLVDDLLAELVPLFPGPLFHVGADETFELGRGRTRGRAEAEGLGPVYLGHLARLARLLEGHGKEMLFWGDVAREHPALLGELPRSAIAVAWNYDPLESFTHELEPFARAGLRIIVAPGTSSWSTLFPALDAAYLNIRNFIRDGQIRGALGAIVTTWDDDGDSLFDLTWPAIVFGSACAWEGGAPEVSAFEDRYDWAFYRADGHAFRDALRLLARSHTILGEVGRGPSNAILWLDPFSPEGARYRADALPQLGEVRLAAEEALELLMRNRGRARAGAATLPALELAARRLDALGLKFQLADEIVRAYGEAYEAAGDPAAVAAALREVSDIDGRLQDLRDLFVELGEAHAAVWPRENRPHYLGSVLIRYQQVAASMEARIQKMVEVRARYRFERTLPAPAELGFWPAPDPAAAR